ncbi:MAG: ubiquinol-cytochrome c reductase iron-sulfur subunit [Thermoplasmata archaeon]
MKRRGLDEEERAGITRRSFLRGAVVAGSVGLVGAAGFGTVVSLISPPTTCRGELLSSFLYINPEGVGDVWFVREGLVGEEARITDFQPGRAANALWKATISDDGQIACGFSALLIQMDPSELTFPDDFVPAEFVLGGLYAIFNCCTHACCRPSWQLIPRSGYKVDLGYENIYCPCHDSQYNPRVITKYQHPPPPDASGAEYFAVHKEVGVGPAPRGMPLIPLELEGTKIIGRVKNQGWYQYLDSKSKTIPVAEGESG